MATNNVFEFILSEKIKHSTNFASKLRRSGSMAPVENNIIVFIVRSCIAALDFTGTAQAQLFPRKTKQVGGQLLQARQNAPNQGCISLGKVGELGTDSNNSTTRKASFLHTPPLQRRAPQRRVRSNVQRLVRRKQTIEGDQQEILESAPDSGHDPGPHDDLSDHPELIDCFSKDGFDPGKFEEFTTDF